MSTQILHTVLSAENLAVGHGRKSVLREVNISAARACFIGLSGRNGSGKSTLIRTMAGLNKPLEGRVLVEGLDLHRQKTDYLAKHVGLVLTKRPSVDFMQVKDMVSMGRYPYLTGISSIASEDRLIVDRALDQAGITGLADKYLNEISDGEFQKAMIARVLSQQTPVMILDEPTAFLDHESKVQLFTLLRHLAETQNKTIICATHDMELAARYTHVSWAVKEGRVEVV